MDRHHIHGNVDFYSYRIKWKYLILVLVHHYGLIHDVELVRSSSFFHVAHIESINYFSYVCTNMSKPRHLHWFVHIYMSNDLVLYPLQDQIYVLANLDTMVLDVRLVC